MLQTLSSDQKIYAAIIDNGCVYERARRPGVCRADYGELARVIKDRVPALWPPAVVEHPLHLCTSAPTTPDEKFSRFITTLEETGFSVYMTKGAPAYVKDLRGYSDDRLADRVRITLQRQDALVGYLIGRLVETRDLVVVSDSPGVIHTLTIAALRRKSQSVLMAPRSILSVAAIETLERNQESAQFVDLDEQSDRIFIRPVRRDEPESRFIPKI